MRPRPGRGSAEPAPQRPARTGPAGLAVLRASEPCDVALRARRGV